MALKDPARKAKDICRLLIENYGDTVVERKLDPLDELVLTILSQNTNDVNMFRAYENLREHYSSWEEVLKAPMDELGEVIKPSGFFRVKARRIKATLQEIQDRIGRLDLAHLEDMPLKDATEWLVSLHGVGPKTASIVLLFCFGKATLPVDTHVWRLSKRLGLIPENTSRESAQSILEELVPPDCIYSLNHNLIKHGRDVCKALKPRCAVCLLNHVCDYFSSHHGDAGG